MNKEDLEAKQRARASAAAGPGVQAVRNGSSNGSGQYLADLDRDIEAKNRARQSMLGNLKPVPPPSTSTNNNISNADKEAKDRARSTVSGPAMIPGAVSHMYAVEEEVDVDNMDRKMTPDELAKANARSGKPAYIDVDDCDDEDDKKMKGSAGGGGAAMPMGMDASAKQKAEDDKGRAGAIQSDGGDMTKKGGGKDTSGFAFEDVEDGRLAVAQAVEEEEEEDDAFIPAALEYDPDSKPALHKTKRFRLWALLGFLFLAGGVVAAILIPTQMNQANMDMPTPAPTTYRESLGIQEKIENIVGTEVLEDEDSPYSRALDWIINKDPMQLSLESDHLLQRFILAYFYFATTKHGPWRSCNPAAGNETSECALKSFVKVRPLKFEDQPNMIRWLSEEHECKWATVVCNEDDVVYKLDTCK